MEKRPLIITFCAIILVLAIAFMLLSNGTTGNVVSEIHESAYLNQPLAGTFKITVEQTDNLPPSTPLFVALFRGNKEINVQTMTLGEFAKMSGTPPVLDASNNYVGPATYEVPIAKLIPDKLTESGEYELIFGLPKIDLLIKKVITVQ
ncbi:MAG: hypothetical protein WCK90_03260 [archaeon]